MEQRLETVRRGAIVHGHTSALQNIRPENCNPDVLVQACCVEEQPCVDVHVLEA